MADLSALSTEDLLALKAGDLSKVSTAGLQALKGEQAPLTPPIASDAITKGAEAVRDVSPAALIAGSAPGRFLLQPARGLMELGSHLGLPGGESARETGKLIEEGRAAYENKGMDIAGLAGQIASPAVLGAAKAAPAIIAAKGIFPRMLQSAVVGGTAGAVTPTEDKGNFGTEKAEQIGSGAALGAVLPPAGALTKALGRTIYSAFEPIIPGGPEAIFNRFKDSKIPLAVRDKVVQALQGAKEFVSGSKPTVGEAIADIPEATNIASHQRLAARTGEGAPGLFARKVAQEQARAEAVGDVAKAPDILATAEAGRAAEAAKGYGNAFNQTVTATPELAKLAQDPYFKAALPDAIDLAKSKGINAKDNLTQFLHYVKVGLDKQLSRSGDTALAATEKEAVQGVKAKLTAWMDSANPEYAAARARFQELSGPIDQMKIGQTFASKLAGSTGASEKAATYSSALRNPEAVLQEAGVPQGVGLEKVMRPDQLEALNRVGADLSRTAKFERLSRQSGVESPGEVKSPLPNLLSRPAMALNFFAKRVLGHDLQSKVNAVAGEQYLSPERFVESLLPQASSKAKQAIVDALMSQKHLGSAVVTGGPAVGLAQQY